MTGGGQGFPNYSSVEVLYSGGAPWCRLPSLPDQRLQHSQAGLVTCGGYSSATSCLTFSGAAGWAASHSLLEARRQHCSWASPGGVLLLGGLNTGLSSELLQDGGGGSTEAFPLKYETKLVISISQNLPSSNDCPLLSSACSIELSDRVVVTGYGGSYSYDQATVYTEAGWLEDLPRLLTGRYYHACGHFVNEDHQLVAQSQEAAITELWRRSTW